MKHPYAIPARLSPNLVRIRAYWRGLLRGGATMPFWDDLDPADLGDLKVTTLLVDVFAHPERFRINTCGVDLGGGASLAGQFIDEVDLAWPFEYLRSQCSATVEAATATYFRLQESVPSPPSRPYGRLLLPLWGEGRIGMLLGAFDLA